MSTDTKYIIKLGIYEPYRIFCPETGFKEYNPKFNKETGGYLLDLKEGKKEGINVYFKKMCDLFDDPDNAENLEANNWGITCVPSSKADKIGEGLEKLIIKLCEKYNIENMCGNLRRKYKIQKLAEGGNRDIQVHLDSIDVVDEKLFENRCIMIIDDITTTGNSLKACEKLVEDCGAIITQCIALGETAHH